MTFAPEFLGYLRRLQRNNRRAWFHAHKDDYVRHVKQPFDEFVEELIHRLAAKGVRLGITPREAVFRLARDTRFSKDKTPYKTWMAAVLAPGGRKSARPGLYFHFGTDGAYVAGGAYEPDRDQLYAIRKHIASDGAALQRLLAKPRFKRMFGELKGEKNKRLPPEFREAAERQPLLYHKQFYYVAEYQPELVLRKDLAGFLVRHWETGKDVNRWLEKAIAT